MCDVTPVQGVEKIRDIFQAGPELCPSASGEDGFRRDMSKFESADPHDNPGALSHPLGDPGNNLELFNAIGNDHHIRLDRLGNEKVLLAVSIEIKLLGRSSGFQRALGLIVALQRYIVK